MNSFWIAVAVMLFSVFIASVAQVLLKKSAGRSYKNWLREYLNIFVITAYGLLLSSTLFTMFALRKIPLSMAPVLEAAGYIFVAVMGYLFLKERFSRRKIAGLALILVGILIFTL